MNLRHLVHIWLLIIQIFIIIVIGTHSGMEDIIFTRKFITQRDYDWLSKDFYAISFEKSHSVREDHENLFNNPVYQSKLTARQMVEIAQEESEEGYEEVWD